MNTTRAERLIDLALADEPLPTPAELLAAFPACAEITLLARGGMSLVYKAHQPSLDRTVAIKLLPSARDADPEYLARFHREALALARLRHPSIVTIHDFGTTTGGRPWFIMEYVAGSDLHTHLQSGPIPPRQAIAIATQIADALHTAHAAGIIHRDIKPSNILLHHDATPRLADFGIARHLAYPPPGTPPITAPHTILGTPDYMAPEQRDGQPADQRSDIYALATVLYQMLTGALPRGSFPPASTLSTSHPALDKILTRALHPDPARRPQNVLDFKTQLQTTPAERRPPSATHPIILLPILLTLAGAITLATYLYPKDTPAATATPPPPRAPIISPSGTAYTDIAASSTVEPRHSPANLFDEHPTPGQPLDSETEFHHSAYAGNGAVYHYLRFSLDRPHTITSLYYAQRDYLDRHNPKFDKITAIEIWSMPQPGTPTQDPGRPPDRRIPITHLTDDTFLEYPIGAPLEGQHFLLCLIPAPHNPDTAYEKRTDTGAPASHPGGTELRLGGIPK